VKTTQVLSRLSAAAAVALAVFFIGTAGDALAGDARACQDFSGAWHTKDSAASELRVLQRGCVLEGSFTAANGASKKKLKHTFTAIVSGPTATGSVIRTDHTGCKTQLKITIVMERDKLVYRTTQSDGARDLPPGFTEHRDWLRISSIRQVRAFHCPDCGQVLGKCAGNIVGSRCVFCASPSGQCVCTLCGKKFYEISHAHNE
jgi:hypothetical protein